ncbi:hypothetical protein RhiirC2_854392 [Rhizophagus irregularis]|uniref:Uncharacterized protein n=1 Tax=Rhizophagus irregularis TaxID=588596 RepID=A0A2N1MRT6_9GLOM|nr:hypothetical protein RhiirC2_855052 [Rhizophagus irregularis]PKK64340.1 hypothetical protein RhiirC2_854392 [Rhizophagus irregularis]
MNLDSRAQYKLVSVGYSDVNFKEYRRILEALCPLKNPRILSKNGYIIMCEKLYENDKVHGHPTNYIYCSPLDSGNTISNEHARRNEILQSIDKLFSQPTSHSKKDKLASVLYDHDGNFMASYENYAQFKAKDTMPSAPNFESTCISVTSGNQKKFFEQRSRPTSPSLPQKPIKLMGSLERYPMQYSASASEFRNL